MIKVKVSKIIEDKCILRYSLSAWTSVFRNGRALYELLKNKNLTSYSASVLNCL